MESWRKTWRDGVVPNLEERHLLVLKDFLERDDHRLMQGATTTPPPLQCVQDWPTEAACPFGLCGWQGDELTTVSAVEEFFARLCFEIDRRLGEPAGCRWFLNWWDATPRSEAVAELLAEVNLALANFSRERFVDGLAQ